VASSFNDASVNGIRGWTHLTHTIQEHECTGTNPDACLTIQRWRVNKTLENKKLKIEGYEMMAKSLREKIINVTLLLASCNLPFRGQRERELS
jgi:hypothetical protein